MNRLKNHSQKRRLSLLRFYEFHGMAQNA